MAHVVVTTTLPVLDCLWLEKVLHTPAKNNFNTSKRPQHQIPAKEARTSFHLQTIHTNTVANTVRERPSLQTATMFTLKQNLKETDLLTQVGRTMSFTSFPFCNTRRAQNPNQPRLLSTSCNFWHNMSRATWQLKATFATSQSCRTIGNFVAGSM